MFVVYTHCSHKDKNRAWRRDNALKRLFPNYHLIFHDVDLKPNESKDYFGFKDLKNEIEERALIEGEAQLEVLDIQIKEFVERQEAEGKPLLENKQLITDLLFNKEYKSIDSCFINSIRPVLSA